MKYLDFMCLIIFSMHLSACTMGIYHVSEQPQLNGDGIYLMKMRTDCTGGTYEDVNYSYRSGRYPDVAPDKALVFVKPIAINFGDPVFQQIWRENVLLTHTPGDKRYPRWGSRWFAYEQDTGSGKKIVVHSHNNLTIFTLSPEADGGLDFFENGEKIVFTRTDGVYWIAAVENAVENRIASCGTFPNRCRFPVVSHDGSARLPRYHSAHDRMD
jgi:hypothetical protein